MAQAGWRPCRGAWIFLWAVPSVALDNGLGLTPPRGWRSWNRYDCTTPDKIITQAHMEAQMRAVVNKSRLVDGKPTSLAELGFDYVSMDDGWQECNCSVRQDLDPSKPPCPNLCFGGYCTFHDSAGIPLVRKSRFPDMQGLVKLGHSLGLKVGGYLNNCMCMEARNSATHYEQDVHWLAQTMGFDEVKIDNCGTSKNVSHWAELFNHSGKPIRIENCHNSWPDFATGFCPMNFYRTGGDISPDINSIMGEVYSTVNAADLPDPRSRPGCWAYPDMNEIGNFAPGPHQLAQERSHWGLWCIVSSPLILGFDMNDSMIMDRIWPTITNREALAVSAAWAGHPGTLVKVYLATGKGFQAVQGACDGSAATLGWSFGQGGNLIAPKVAGMPVQQCLQAGSSAACPPPTTHDSSVQCGLNIANCTDLSPHRWAYSNKTVQWFGGNAKKDAPQCLSAQPLRLDTSKDYYTRQAAIIKMDRCPGLRGEAPTSSCPAAASGTDAEGPEVIVPEDPSRLCGIGLDACCAACDNRSDCAAFVWKAHEERGPGCARGGPYCWLLSGFSGTRPASGATFGTKRPLAGAAPPAAAPSLPPPPPTAFELTARGELRTAAGGCLTAAPVNGAELWAKPMPGPKLALLLLNTVDEPQVIDLRLADLPHFPGSFACAPGTCVGRDVWEKQDFEIPADRVSVALGGYASAFFVLRSRGAEAGRATEEISV